MQPNHPSAPSWPRVRVVASVLERVGGHAVGDSGAHRRGRLAARLAVGLIGEAGEEFLREI